MDDDNFDPYGRNDITDIAPSESDLSQIIKKREGPRKSIEIFSGNDPMFNFKNAALRISRMTRKDVCLLLLLIFVVLCAVVAVLVWFKVKLRGYRS